jgi:2-dehydro-3-deoxyphosphogluconate aldolase/(4S)-4-hydroxy-2-oxoglutarate aldolase
MSVDFSRTPVIPVIVLDNADHAVPTAHALLEGGIRIIEITFRTDAAAESIRRIAQELPEMWVGAGTVVTPDQAKSAIDSGSQFGLAPGCDGETLEIFDQASIPFIPGIMTPSDIQKAVSLGCTRMKFFPAGAAGGPKMLKSMSAPYLNLGVSFCPTGGVSEENMREYLDLPQVFAVGGSWIATKDLIQQEDWSAITARASAAMKLAAD